jgi:hypothetical protein
MKQMEDISVKHFDLIVNLYKSDNLEKNFILEKVA